MPDDTSQIVLRKFRKISVTQCAVSLALFVVVAVSMPFAETLHGPQPSRAVPLQFFGMHIDYADERTPWPTSQIGTWRLWDPNVSWADLEPRRGEWRFGKLDRLVQIATQHHAELVLTLAYTPQWASLRPNESSSSGRMGVAAPPKDLADWRTYVQTVATRYRGKIQYYEFWNEPNDHGFYSGDLKTLVQMGKDAYVIIKAADPQARVLSPAMMGSGPGVRMLDAYLRAGGAVSFDILSYHFYVTPKSPEAMLPNVAEVQAVMRSHGIERIPLWMTEVGWTAPYRYDPGTAPAYVVRTYLLAWALGIDRVFWYAWDNQHWSTIQMVASDGRTENGAAKAFSNAERIMLGKKLRECQNTGANWSCEFVDSMTGKSTIVFWNQDGHTAVSNFFRKDAALVLPLTPSQSLPDEDGKISFNGQPIAVERK